MNHESSFDSPLSQTMFFSVPSETITDHCWSMNQVHHVTTLRSRLGDLCCHGYKNGWWQRNKQWSAAWCFLDLSILPPPLVIYAATRGPCHLNVNCCLYGAFAEMTITEEHFVCNTQIYTHCSCPCVRWPVPEVMSFPLVHSEVSAGHLL